MRRISLLATILITCLVTTLAGLVASPIATASENETARVSSRFAFGSPLLTNTHKSTIEKAVTTFGTDATFEVTAEAGKLPGVSDSEVQLLATKRGQVFKSYLVKLGVDKSSVTIKVKITRLGIVPKTKIVGSFVAPVATTATGASTNNATRQPPQKFQHLPSQESQHPSQALLPLQQLLELDTPELSPGLQVLQQHLQSLLQQLPTQQPSLLPQHLVTRLWELPPTSSPLLAQLLSQTLQTQV